jgi:hypothetical protein
MAVSCNKQFIYYGLFNHDLISSALLVTVMEVGLDVNADKIKYMCLCRRTQDSFTS